MKKILFVSLVLTLVVACNPPHIDQEKLKDERLNRKIVMATKGEILSQAQENAEAILALDPLNNSSLVDSLSKDDIAKVEFFQPSDLSAADENQKMYVESYQVAVSEGNVPTSVPEISKKDRNRIIYTKPVIEGKKLKGVYFVTINASYMIKHMETKM